MTETITTAGETTDAKLCRAGSATDHPCWRPATETDIGETEPTLCAEHMKVRHLGEDIDGWHHSLENIQTFMESEAVKDDPFATLRQLTDEWMDQVTKSASKDAIRFRVAKFLADRGPDDPGPKESIMREYMGHQLVLSDALDNAYLVLMGRENRPRRSASPSLPQFGTPLGTWTTSCGSSGRSAASTGSVPDSLERVWSHRAVDFRPRS